MTDRTKYIIQERQGLKGVEIFETNKFRVVAPKLIALRDSNPEKIYRLITVKTCFNLGEWNKKEIAS